MHKKNSKFYRDIFICLLLCLAEFQKISTQVVETVSQIPVQYPLTGPDNEIKYYPVFSVELSSTVQISQIQAQGSMYKDWKTCGAILQPFYITLEFNFPGYFEKFKPGLKSVLMKFPPDSRHVDLTYSATNLFEQNSAGFSLCNPYINKNCDICVNSNKIFRTNIDLIRKDSSTGIFGQISYIEKTLMKNYCLFMESMDCGPKTCNNGEYSTEYLRVNSAGWVTSKNKCLPCPPGTWLTCINDMQCTYDIPSSPGSYEPGEDMHSQDFQSPVGSCFTCDSAGRKVHYKKTSAKQIIDAYARLPLPWICPGGSGAPRMCPPQFVGADANFSSCVCKPGEYQVAGDRCEACPAGSRCPDGAREDCPDDFYQSEVGQVDCLPCLSPTGIPLGCPFNTSMRKCTGQYKKEAPFCVTCNMCARDYVSHPAGRVDCY